VNYANRRSLPPFSVPTNTPCPILYVVLIIGGATAATGGGNGTGNTGPAWGTKVKLSDEPRVAHFKLGLQEDIAKHYVKSRSGGRETVPPIQRPLSHPRPPSLNPFSLHSPLYPPLYPRGPARRHARTLTKVLGHTKYESSTRDVCPRRISL